MRYVNHVNRCATVQNCIWQDTQYMNDLESHSRSSDMTRFNSPYISLPLIHNILSLSYNVFEILPLFGVRDCLWPWKVFQFQYGWCREVLEFQGDSCRRNRAPNDSFLERKIRILNFGFSTQQRHILAQNHVFLLFFVKIFAGVLSWEEKPKNSQVNKSMHEVAHAPKQNPYQF